MLTLQIYGSIIFPSSYTSVAADAVAIDITPPAADASKASGHQVLKTGCDNPLYFLPQSLSGGMKVHLNRYTKPRRAYDSRTTGGENIHRHSRISSIDRENILYEVQKSFVSQEYTISSFGSGKPDDGYGEGVLNFTPGWISGGQWTIEYKYKLPGNPTEQRIEAKVDEGGKEHGIWKMTYPSAMIIAKENPQPADASFQNMRSIDIEDVPQVECWDTNSWRDFLAACWIVKIWSDCTRDRGKVWLGKSIRSIDRSASALRTY